MIDQFLGVSFNVEEQAVYDKHWNNIKTYMLEKQQIWVLGSEDVIEGWDAYQAELEKLGLSKVIEAMQSAYDRQYGAS